MKKHWDITSKKIGFDPAFVVERRHGLAGVYPGHETIEARLAELRALPSGWDGYRGVATSPAASRRAHEFLHAALSASARLPSVVPGAAGDLQLEWHMAGVDLEVGLSDGPEVEIRLSIPDAGVEDFETVLEMRDAASDDRCACGYVASAASADDRRGALAVARQADSRAFSGKGV